MRIANNDISIFESEDRLYKTACDFIAELAKDAVLKRGRFTLVLSGGHTPEKLYNMLSSTPYDKYIPWKDTYVFWGDERCVPPNDKRNNAHRARELLLNKVAISASNIFPVNVNLPPVEAAKEYDKRIKDFFSDTNSTFDLILLGLGENGHTASLFPMTSVLHEFKHWVKEVYLEDQSMYRVTMTASLINSARQILFLVCGKNKAEVLNRVLLSPYQPEILPAQIIQPLNGKLQWFADRGAASLLNT
jgi:6-phosphogluconolactonase